jgi:hypothetical protein
MNIAEIQNCIESKELVLEDGKLYTREEWESILHADRQEQHYDLLQLTKKIQL